MKSHTFILYGILAFALLGALDAGYLTTIALSGDPLVCNFVEGCQVVAKSSYSKFLGIPLYLFGFFFYVVAAGIAAWALTKPSRFAGRLLLFVSLIGILASAYFTYLQAVVIKAWCEYCIFSALMSLLLFVSALWYVMKGSTLENKVS